MDIVITGASGFIGSKLVQILEERGFASIFCANSKTSSDDLMSAVKGADVVFHLAGNAKTNGEASDYEQDIRLAKTICDTVASTDKDQLLVLASSVWASGEDRFKDSPYTEAKRTIEECFLAVPSASTGIKTTCIFRLPNVFGEKHPNKEGTAVANFCKALAIGDVPKVNDPSVMLTMCYAKDVAQELADSIKLWQKGANPSQESPYRQVNPIFEIAVGELAEKIAALSRLSDNGKEASQLPALDQRLLSVYESYL